MKLIKRQKRIILVFALSFLTLIVAAATILIANKNQNSFPAPRKNNLPNDKSNLMKVKTETINFLEQKLSSKNTKMSFLLQELKGEHSLKANETNLRKYIEGATSLAELEIWKNKVLEIVEKLVSKSPPPPIQIPPSSPDNNSPVNSPDQTETTNNENNNQSPEPNNQPEGNKNPSPTNPTPPTNKWEKTLWEVKNLLDTNPSSEEIKKWAKDKETEIGDPLTGINLKGADKSTLLSLNKGGGQSEIVSKNGGEAEAWKDFVSLSSAGDGNCFLNSFAILLTGSQARDSTKETPGTQENVATRLRAALCLEIMKNYDTADLVEKEDLKNYFCINHKALATDNCRYIVRILKRPVVMVHKIGANNSDILSTWYDNFFFGSTSLNEEPFFVYHVGSYHFEPLVRKTEHQQGEIYFNFAQVNFEDENNSSGNRSIVFNLTPGTLRKENFSPTQNSRLNSADFQNQNKIRVLCSKNDEETKQFFIEERNRYIEYGAKKTNRDISILILKANEVLVSGNKIDFNHQSIREIRFR